MEQVAELTIIPEEAEIATFKPQVLLTPRSYTKRENGKGDKESFTFKSKTEVDEAPKNEDDSSTTHLTSSSSSVSDGNYGYLQLMLAKYQQES
jgi:hypothetical protein